MPNRLAGETSPYLLQHAENPVDWSPWTERALAEAAERDVPILLSIGYSACHWCHVMERESFEDEAVAARMNEQFVPIKLDREERPDLDAIYMEACQAITGHGGWPLNVFLTPDQVPFHAGTYFPPRPRQGMPSWTQVLEAVAAAWRDRGDEIRAAGDGISAQLGGAAALAPSDTAPTPEALEQAIDGLRVSYDPEHGGFGTAPKFPPASAIEFLLCRGEHDMALQTLRAMARGGMYDLVGGGFARYSVDRRWLVPHFEKMLYDNALLARAYLHGWQVSGDALLRRVCEETLDWMVRDLRGPEGGFMSALDADSEGEEGRFYVWTPATLKEALGAADAAVAAEHFGVDAEGNFEGATILTRGDAEPPDLASLRAGMLEARDRRVWPATDDKRLTSWNALAIAALAECGAVLGRSDYLAAATGCADFVLEVMRDDRGRLLRSYKDGRAHLNAYLEDHAFLIEALTALYEASGDSRHLASAREIARIAIDHFADDRHGGFFETSDDHERLIARRKDIEDHPIPSGNASMALGLLRMHHLTGEGEYADRADGILRLLAPIATRHPQAFGHLLQALDLSLARVLEVAVAGADSAAFEAVVRERFRPHVVLAAGAGEGVPLLAGRTPVDGRTAAYVCEGFACRAPVTEPDALREQLA